MKGKLAERYIVPPFSVLDARQGYWQERKRAWLRLGLTDSLGRDAGLLIPSATGSFGYYKAKRKKEEELGRVLSHEEFERDFYVKAETGPASGTSLFDPVLAEILVAWFTAVGALILDPFAGGPVRGVVSSLLGRQYIGIDLRAEQVAANEVQADRLCRDAKPVWINGDSRRIDRLCPGVQADLILTCPPYFDLERYSKDPADLSNMRDHEFRFAYREILSKACRLLREDRFACIVVGDVRDRRGLYRGFLCDTISAFRQAGLALYNEAVLVTQAGSLPVRAGKPFEKSRKLGKAHQNVLVFAKGNPCAAAAWCAEVDVFEIAAAGEKAA